MVARIFRSSSWLRQFLALLPTLIRLAAAALVYVSIVGAHLLCVMLAIVEQGADWLGAGFHSPGAAFRWLQLHPWPVDMVFFYLLGMHHW